MRIAGFKTTITGDAVKFSTSLDAYSLDVTGSMVLQSDAIILGTLSCANLRGGTVLQPYTLSYAGFIPTAIGAKCYFIIPMDSKLLAAYGVTDEDFSADNGILELCSSMGARLSTIMTIIGAAHVKYTLTPDYTIEEDRRVAFVKAGSVLFFDTTDISAKAISLSLKLEPLLKGGQYV